MTEAAHEIRFAGNEAAYGDLVAEPLSIRDANAIVSLMDTIRQRVYQEPANVTRIRNKREQRRAKAKVDAELTGMDLNTPTSRRMLVASAVDLLLTI
jgi:hypothetical protein